MASVALLSGKPNTNTGNPIAFNEGGNTGVRQEQLGRVAHAHVVVAPVTAPTPPPAPAANSSMSLG